MPGNDRVKIGLIRVLTMEGAEAIGAQARFLESHYPVLDITTRVLPDQPRGVYDDESEKAAEPKVASAARELEDLGMDAIIVSCAADPGVLRARQQVRIPVIGAGTAGALVARAFGKPVGVMTLNGDVPRPVNDILGSMLVASTWPKGVKTALDLSTEEGIEAIRRAGIELRANGSQVILLACTGMTLLKVFEWLPQSLRLPVVDPLLSAALLASGIGRMQAIGRG